MTERPSQPSAEPYVIADHPVLDMLNTVAMVDGTACDFWRSDDDVLRWCASLGIDVQVPSGLAEGALLDSARRLREAIRELVERRKAGLAGDPTVLNDFLREAASHPRLVWNADGDVHVERIAERSSPAQMLAPLSEQAAELIGSGDFQLIRQCEHPDCTLWFYDRTKSHRRRWCSMALCGNRHKVAEHRKRQRQE